MTDLKSLKITPVDAQAARDGTWTKYRGVDLKIARAGNEKFAKTFMRLSRPHRKDIQQDTIDNKIAADIMCEALADGILVGWKNFVINDEEIEFNKENAFSLLKNDEDCRKFVQEFAQDLNNFIVADKENTVAKS